MKNLMLSAAFAVAAFSTTHATAATLQLDGFTSSLQTVHVDSSPVAGTPSRVGASGFEMTDTSGTLGSFVAWCLDIAHYLMGTGDSQDYIVTSNPYSNSDGLSAIARDRVQSVFDANYESVDFSIGDQAAAFQMALWEAAFETAGTLSVLDGAFQANSSGSTALANSYLTSADSYAGDKVWKLTFLEVDGYDSDRGMRTGQNLVTVSPIPVPAAGVMLLTGLLGFGALSRRRKS